MKIRGRILNFSPPKEIGGLDLEMLLPSFGDFPDILFLWPLLQTLGCLLSQRPLVFLFKAPVTWMHRCAVAGSRPSVQGDGILNSGFAVYWLVLMDTLCNTTELQFAVTSHEDDNY